MAGFSMDYSLGTPERRQVYNREYRKIVKLVGGVDYARATSQIL
jgi:hypothetical protein